MSRMVLVFTLLTSFGTSAVTEQRADIEQLKKELNDMRTTLARLDERYAQLENQCVQLAQGVSIESTSRPLNMNVKVNQSQLNMESRSLHISSDILTLTGKILKLKADSITIDGKLNVKGENDVPLRGSSIGDN